MAIAVTYDFSQPQPSPRLDLIQRVVEPFGNVNDQELQASALKFLDETVKEYNSALYEFNKIRLESIAIVADQSEYDLPTAFYREYMCLMIRTADGLQEPPLTYLPHPQVVREYNTYVYYPNVGMPRVYTLFNSFNQGKLKLAPTPDARTASSYTMTLMYYRRISLVSQQDPLDVPQELEVPLVYGGQKRMAIHLNGASDPDVSAFQALETEALNNVKTMDRRHPDEMLRFKLVDSRYRTFPAQGTVYIRVR